MLGEHVAAEIRKGTVPADPDSWEYVDRIARRVATPGLPLQLELRMSWAGEPPLGALWAPGHLFVSTRLLILARSEAELAGALAHAIACSTERGAGSIPLIGCNPFDSATRIRVDRRAIAALAAAGYNPRALLDFVARNAAWDKLRIAALEDDVAAVLPRAAWIENTSDFVQARERARRALTATPTRPTLFRKDR